jgi:hypothetical protein
MPQNICYFCFKLFLEDRVIIFLLNKLNLDMLKNVGLLILNILFSLITNAQEIKMVDNGKGQKLAYSSESGAF